MAGIYVHIPFCKSRCKYCDFFSTTLFEKKWPAYKEAFLKELGLRKDPFLSVCEHSDETVDTLYFGGGTPSLTCEADIEYTIRAIREHLPGKYVEITMEANPGDLSEEKLVKLRQAGVNRLSIGVQSFNDSLLHSIGRRHSSNEAKKAIEDAQKAGFDNISIDLMYGLPNETMDDWQEDVETACSMGVQHISAYCLTYEEGTPLYKALQIGQVAELDDDLLNEMQDYATKRLAEHGFYHYEVSNYALLGRESKHNSAYWRHTPYLGIGAGAHSYDGKNHRQWNPDDLQTYIDAVNQAWDEKNADKLPLDGEFLSEEDQYNEIVMLGLRTSKGIDIEHLPAKYLKHFLTSIEISVNQGWVEHINNHYRATEQGFHLLNQIIESVMI